MGENTIEPDRYQVGHMYYYPSWLKDDVAGVVKPGIKLKGRIIDEEQKHKKNIGGCVHSWDQPDLKDLKGSLNLKHNTENNTS